LDSRLRDKSKYPSPSHYVLDLEEELHDVQAIALVDARIPKTAAVAPSKNPGLRNTLFLSVNDFELLKGPSGFSRCPVFAVVRGADTVDGDIRSFVSCDTNCLHVKNFLPPLGTLRRFEIRYSNTGEDGGTTLATFENDADNVLEFQVVHRG
jgi:hypothetical protein